MKFFVCNSGPASRVWLGGGFHWAVAFGVELNLTNCAVALYCCRVNAPIIFYSWQSDSKRRWNQFFIENCLEEAVATVSQQQGLRNGIILQRDTTGVPGMPSIPATIFERIDKCAVFIGDVSFVGRALPKTTAATPQTGAGETPPPDTQMFPNANVVLELGYAAKSIGWKRIICVMNTAYGKPDDQIFHFLQHRFPVTYSLTDQAQEQSARKGLVGKLSKYLTQALNELHADAIRTTQKLNADCFLLVRYVSRVEYFSHETVTLEGNPELRQKLQEIFPETVDRLLDLGVIFTHHDQTLGTYSYHWTYLGDRVKILV